MLVVLVTMVYGQRFPFRIIGGNKITFSNYIAYTLMRYYELVGELEDVHKDK